MSNSDTRPTRAPEQWRPVPGFEGAYEVSDHGSLRSLDRLDARGRHLRGVNRPGTPNSSGHLVVGLSFQGRAVITSIHCLVLEAFVGPRPEGMEGCHFDDDPTNNHISNLRWDTRSANKRDAARNGRGNSGKTHCDLGHKLVAPNIPQSQAARGWRQCRACQNAHAQARNLGTDFDPAYADARYALIMGTGAAAA